jgi:hypothetical protein
MVGRDYWTAAIPSSRDAEIGKRSRNPPRSKSCRTLPETLQSTKRLPACPLASRRAEHAEPGAADVLELAQVEDQPSLGSGEGADQLLVQHGRARAVDASLDLEHGDLAGDVLTQVHGGLPPIEP